MKGKSKYGIFATSDSRSKFYRARKAFVHFFSNIRAYVARFDWHKGPITSIEWHPSDDSVLAVSSDDHQVTIWDLAVEPDKDTMPSNGIPNIPPQLLFFHYQEGAKELHWHPQIPGAIISPGIGSLNVFKTIVA